MLDCQKDRYYRCPEWGKAETDVAGNDQSGVSHAISHKIEINTGLKTLYSIKTNRTFSVQGYHDYDKDIYHVWSVECGGLAIPPCFAWCYDRRDRYKSDLSEDCKIEKDTIYYIDLSRNILFYKHEEEELKFTSASTETSAMRQKWGTSIHHKLKIKGAKIKGKEEHVLIFNGQRRVLNTVIYEREPEWEMEAIGIPSLDSGVKYLDEDACAPYRDPELQQIILWGIPPSKAIPMDPEVRCRGFYDYGSESPGAEPRLLRPDGGKDFFYPSWCRSMMPDPMWRSAADSRVALTWDHVPPAGTTDYYGENVLYDPVPKGNAFIHTKLGDMFCFVYRNRDGEEFVVSELNGADPSGMIMALDVTGYGEDWAYHPISVV